MSSSIASANDSPDDAAHQGTHPWPGAHPAQRGQLLVEVSFQAPSLHHNDPSLAHALYDNNIPFSAFQQTQHHPVSPRMDGYHPFSPQQHSSGWQNQVHLIASPLPPPPPQIMHKVWILDCKSCGTFLTNRGMKAVLLLRPNVSLFSTDALPINCSAYSSTAETLRSSFGPTARPHVPARTCECLTQTLCCHGCGNSIGYMIVIPCSRCTTTITATNHAANGHRFVFHTSEIVSTERHYIPDEPGVIPYDMPIPSTENSETIQPPQLLHSTSPSLQSRRQSVAQSHQHLTRGHPSFFRADHLPTPPLEASDPFYNQSQFPDAQIRPLSPQQHLVVPSQASPPADHKDACPSPMLAGGDMLYWHHLVQHGEIPGVEEDRRARRGSVSVKSATVFDR